MRLLFLLLGYARCAVAAERAAAFLNLCHDRGLIYTPLGTDGETGELLVACRLPLLKGLLRACREGGIGVRVVKRGGLPVLLWRYRRRAGLAVGVLIAAVLTLLAQRVIWDIRIEGNETVSLPRLQEQLRESGLWVGCSIPELDTDEVEARLLTTSEEIAWVSVNIKGTVAYVQIRELMSPQSEKSEQPTNLVASSDGVVDSVRLLSGQSVVKTGDVVRRGELLVTGVRDSGTYGYRVTSAQGEVMAQTEHTLVVRLPRQMQQKVCVEQKNIEKTLFFFGKTIKITKSTGIVVGNCDTIKKLEIWSLPGGVALPVSTETTVLHRYELQQVTLTDEQLEMRAREELGRQLALATQGATLLSKHITCQITDEGILLTCQYRSLENIALAQPFDTDGAAQNS